MQHAYRPGLWFSKVTTDSIWTFQQGRTNLLSVFISGETEPEVLKWLHTFKVLVLFFSIAWNLRKTQLDVLRTLHFQTRSIVTILMHCAICWCISHDTASEKTGGHRSLVNLKGMMCAVCATVQLGACVWSLLFWFYFSSEKEMQTFTYFIQVQPYF